MRRNAKPTACKTCGVPFTSIDWYTRQTCGKECLSKARSEKSSNKPGAWTKEEIEIIKKHYRQGVKEVQNRLPHRSTVGIRLKAAQIKAHRPQGDYVWNRDEDDILRRHAPLGMNAIASALPSRTKEQISYRARYLRVPLAHPKTLRNKTAFDNLDRTSAYWLGFLAADGSISDDNTVTLAVATKDIHHLEKFRDWIAPERRVWSYVTSPTQEAMKKSVYYTSSLQLSSRYLIERLSSLGVTPRKTHTLTFPELPEDLILDFMRGYSDGDGSFSALSYKTGPKTLRWSLVGNQGFLEEYHRQLIKLDPTLKISLSRDRNHWVLYSTHTPQAVRIGELLYAQKGIHLERKRAIWECFRG